jgi:Fic family protein
MTDSIVCPRCKHIFAPTDQRITDTTLELWQVAGPKFWRGKRMTIRELAQAAHVSPSTARRHLLRLHAVGLVDCVPLRSSPNGVKTYHAYSGRMFSKVS